MAVVQDRQNLLGEFEDSELYCRRLASRTDLIFRYSSFALREPHLHSNVRLENAYVRRILQSRPKNTGSSAQGHCRIWMKAHLDSPASQGD